jgi:hypothetical protein
LGEVGVIAHSGCSGAAACPSAARSRGAIQTSAQNLSVPTELPLREIPRAFGHGAPPAIRGGLPGVQHSTDSPNLQSAVRSLGTSTGPRVCGAWHRTPRR